MVSNHNPGKREYRRLSREAKVYVRNIDKLTVINGVFTASSMMKRALSGKNWSCPHQVTGNEQCWDFMTKSVIWVHKISFAAAA